MSALAITSACVWVLSIALAVRARHTIARTLRTVPVRYRILLGAVLVACAAIPGPVDDLIALAVVARLAHRTHTVPGRHTLD